MAGKSLTEIAKQILQESNDPTPDRDAKAMNPNMATLRPGSRGAEGRIVNPGSMPPVGDIDDLGPALVNNTDIPPSAKAAAKMGKDSSRSSVSAVPAENPRQQAEIMEEDHLDEDEQEIKNKRMKLRTKMTDFWENRPSNLAAKEELKKMFGTKELLNKLAYQEPTKPKGTKKLEEEIEISEELEAFIEAMIEEGYSEEQIAEAIDENFEIVEAKHEKEEPEEKEESEDKEDKKEKMKAMMKEHVDALLAGENLSEDFREKAETIFESAVSVRVEEEIEVLEEAYEKALAEEVESIMEQLTEQVDQYLNYVVENWIEQNEVAIETGLRTEITEEFISGLKTLFAENYIDIPEDKVAVVESLGERLERVESKLNEEIQKNVELTNVLNESKKFEVLTVVTEGLTTTEAEKLKTLAENVSFTTTEEFANKLVTLRESYFPSNVNRQATIDEEPTSDGKLMTEELSGPMAAYVKSLGKTINK